MSEVITRENTVQTLELALEKLASPDVIGVPTELARFPRASVTTTSLDIPSRELDLIDTGNEFILWGTLSPDAWLSRSDRAVSNGAEEVPSVVLSDKRGGEMQLATARPPKAKRLHGAGVYIDFLYHEEYRAYDGMFRVVVPKQVDESVDSQKALIEAGFETAVGGAIFSPDEAAESDNAFKEATYREHHKIEGQLSAEQEQAIANLEIEMTPKGRRRLVDHEQVIDSRIGGVIHEFMRSDNVVGMLADGELLSAKQRMITGTLQFGRSTASDMLYGGSDSVYTSILYSNDSKDDITKPTVQFKRDVLRRLDIRGYENDAYGSRERENPNMLDTRFNRKPVEDTGFSTFVSYETRVSPGEYADKLRASHELCIETSVDVMDIDRIIVPSEPTDYFDDTRWLAVLAPYSQHPNQIANALRIKIKDEGVQAGIETLTKGLGMPQEQAEYYLSGVGLSQMRDRLLKKLSILGVTEVAGRPIEDVIMEAPITS